MATLPRFACRTISAGLAFRCRSASCSASSATAWPTVRRCRKQSAIVLATPKIFYRHILDIHGDDIVREKRIRESHNSYRQAILLRCPVLRVDCHPDCSGKLISQFVVYQRRCEADDSFGNSFCGFGQAMVRLNRRIPQLVKPA